MSAPTSASAPPRAAAAPRRRVLAFGAATGAAAAVAAAGGFLALGPGAGAPRTLPVLDYPIIDGRRIGPDALRGRVVLVNFWATSCAICVAEMPELVAVYRDYRPRGLERLAVAMPYDRPDHVIHFATTRALPFPVALDPMGAAVAAWGGVGGTPVTWLAAPDGRVVRRWVGRPDFARLRREVEALLPGPGGRGAA